MRRPSLLLSLSLWLHPATVAGQAGHALDFDGSGDRVTIPDDPAFDLGNSSPWKLGSARTPSTVRTAFWGRATDSARIIFRVGDPVPNFTRGDANGDGGVDVSDAVLILGYLFGAAPVDCELSLDFDDTESISINRGCSPPAAAVRVGSAPVARKTAIPVATRNSLVFMVALSFGRSCQGEP